MITRPPFQLPEEKEQLVRKAERLEWWSIFFLATIGVAMYFTLGNSQAMKTAWLEDLLSLVPPIAYLIAAQFRHRDPDEKFPYGYRRAITIAFLVASTALLSLGLYMLYDSVMKLISRHHPTIGVMTVFGHTIWMGWVMIGVLVYSAIPPVILGRMKLKPADELHEKVLYADAEMNKADWMTAGAAILGIIGIGFGWWWADSVAAGLISLDVTRDGAKNLSGSVKDLMDQRPSQVRGSDADPIKERITDRVRALSWVKDADVRLREEGDLIAGEIFVVPAEDEGLINRLSEAANAAKGVDWRVYDLVALPVHSLPSRDGSSDDSAS